MAIKAYCPGTHRPVTNLFFLISQLIHVVGTQMNHLNEMVLMSTQAYVKTDVQFYKNFVLKEMRRCWPTSGDVGS